MFAQILNARLETWVENNNILCDEQNGFRKDRSCLDHVNFRNRKVFKKDTFVCFVDAKKAFDTVDRDSLWLKILKLEYTVTSLKLYNRYINHYLAQ